MLTVEERKEIIESCIWHKKSVVCGKQSGVLLPCRGGTNKHQDEPAVSRNSWEKLVWKIVGLSAGGNLSD